MRPLRRMLDKLEPLFARGGRFEKFNAIFETMIIINNQAE